MTYHSRNRIPAPSVNSAVAKGTLLDAMQARASAARRLCNAAGNNTTRGFQVKYMSIVRVLRPAAGAPPATPPPALDFQPSSAQPHAVTAHVFDFEQKQ